VARLAPVSPAQLCRFQRRRPRSLVERESQVSTASILVSTDSTAVGVRLPGPMQIVVVGALSTMELLLR